MTTGFDLKAKEFDRLRGAPAQNELATLLHLLADAKSVLDVGGGTGRYAEPIARAGGMVTIFDRSAPMLHEAEKKGLTRLARGDAAFLPFRDGSFDAVLFVDLLHHVADWARAIRDMGRVARSSVLAVSPERSPNARFIYLTTRARMGKPTGRLDEGVHAILRWLPPAEVVEVRRKVERVDLAMVIREMEFDPAHPDQPRFPEVVEAANQKLVRDFGSTTVEQVESVKVARWDAAAFRDFRPPQDLT